VIELLFEYAVDKLQLLLFLELKTVFRNLLSVVSVLETDGLLLGNAENSGADAQISALLRIGSFCTAI
jgi:hypothetical protein